MPSFTSLSGADGEFHYDSPCLSCLPCCCSYNHHHAPRSGRSMGPFAESLGLSFNMATWLAVVQLPVTMGLALHYPTVRIDVFSTVVKTVVDPANNNQTLAVASSDGSAVQASGYEHGLGISGLYVINAASITFFAVLCMNLMDRGMHMAMVAAAASSASGFDLDSRGAGQSMMGSEEFVAQNIKMVVDPTFRMWNQAFSAMLLITHGTFVATACSPLSWDVLGAYLLLTYISLVSLVQPQNNFYCESAREAAENDEAGGTAAAAGMMASIASQTNMAKSVAYMIAFGYVMMHIWVDANACKAQFMLLLACLDSLLLYGHLWDRVPSLQVVLNCRFIYACLLAVVNVGVFVLWSKCLATPFLSSDPTGHQ